MAFKVFISHSIQDMDFVNSFKAMLRQKGLEAYVALSEPEPGKSLSDKIIENIKSAKYVVCFLTKEGVNSKWIHNEIGIAISMNKIIIPIIEEGVQVPSILQGVEYIKIDSIYPDLSIERVSEYLVGIKTTEDEKKLIIGILLILFGLFIIAIWLSSQ